MHKLRGKQFYTLKTQNSELRIFVNPLLYKETYMIYIRHIILVYYGSFAKTKYLSLAQMLP